MKEGRYEDAPMWELEARRYEDDMRRCKDVKMASVDVKMWRWPL